MHKGCLDRWLAISRKPKSQACPHKCYQTANHAGAELALLSEASQSQEVADRFEGQPSEADICPGFTVHNPRDNRFYPTPATSADPMIELDGSQLEQGPAIDVDVDEDTQAIVL